MPCMYAFAAAEATPECEVDRPIGSAAFGGPALAVATTEGSLADGQASSSVGHQKCRDASLGWWEYASTCDIVLTAQQPELSQQLLLQH